MRCSLVASLCPYNARDTQISHYHTTVCVNEGNTISDIESVPKLLTNIDPRNTLESRS